MEFRFEVLEYLKGAGDDEVVGIVLGSTSDMFNTKLGAQTMGGDLTRLHDTTWDNNEAIVFLSRKDTIPETQHGERYFLGRKVGGSWEFFSDSYSIKSRHSKNWLPAIDSGGTGAANGASSASQSRGEQRFLTGADSDEEHSLYDVAAAMKSAASAESQSIADIADYRVANSAYNDALGSGGDASTLSVADLKDRIAEMEAEIAAGDGSEEYSSCVYEKYKWDREFTYTRNDKDPANRTNHTSNVVMSGLPAGTAFGWGDISDPHPAFFNTTPGFTPDWEAWLEGADAHLFELEQMSIIKTARPLPRGIYRYYFNERSNDLALCDAYPQARRDWNLHTIEVYAPPDVYHEAFFDPVQIDGAVGTDGEYGVIEPAEFGELGEEKAIERLVWQNGQVEIDIWAKHERSLKDQCLDFIRLDGSVSLRILVDDAVADSEEEETTLIWGVCEQPWVDGDLLMLRIAESIPNDGVAATNDQECLTALPEHIFEPAAVPTPEPERTPDPTATIEPTDTPEPESTVQPTP
ncbi:MAG: hypothetical protein OXI16_03030 [Chloroflexota bacterium]|nr:hypothetical protein [Chloroflexota bacterium]